MKKGRQNRNISNEKRDITIDPRDIKTIKAFYKQLYVNNFW